MKMRITQRNEEVSEFNTQYEIYMHINAVWNEDANENKNENKYGMKRRCLSACSEVKTPVKAV